MTLNKLLFSLSFTLAIISCTKERPLESTDKVLSNQTNKSEILNFSSREALDNAISNHSTVDSYGDSLHYKISESQQMFLLRSNTSDDTEIAYTSELVPDPDLAKLINLNGEIIVDDTLYIITPLGTFFGEQKYKNEIYAALTDTASHRKKLLSDDLYQINNHTFRYDTFKGSYSSYEYIDSISSEDNAVTTEKTLKSANSDIPAPNIESFDFTKASKHTFVGKFLQSLGQRKSNVIKFPSNSKRRLNCAAFDYNYVFRQSIGITAKIQHRMWYGAWLKVRSWQENAIRIGYKDVVVRIPYPKGSSYNEIYSKVFSSQSFREPIRYRNTVFRALPNDNWAKHGAINIDLGVFPMITIPTPSKNELVEAAYKYLTSFLRQNINKKYIGDSTNKTFDPFSPSAREDREPFEKQIEKQNLGVPIYAKDGIYVVFPIGYISNTCGENEITYRFFEKYVEFLISWTHKIDSPMTLNGIYKESALRLKNPDAELISGSFYACGYLDSWVGYRLIW